MLVQEWALEAVQLFWHMDVPLRRKLRQLAAPGASAESFDWMPRALLAARPVLFHLREDGKGKMVEQYAERVRRLVMLDGTLDFNSYPKISLIKEHLRMRAAELRKVC